VNVEMVDDCCEGGTLKVQERKTILRRWKKAEQKKCEEKRTTLRRLKDQTQEVRLYLRLSRRQSNIRTFLLKKTKFVLNS